MMEPREADAILQARVDSKADFDVNEELRLLLLLHCLMGNRDQPRTCYELFLEVVISV